MRQKILLIPLLGIAAAAGAAPAPPAKVAAAEPRIRFTGRQTEPGTAAMLRFSVEAPARDPGTVFAYLPEPDGEDPAGLLSPLYQVELLRNGKWVKPFLGWCGTGAGPVKLNGAAKPHFVIPLPPGEWRAMRAGISWTPPGPGNNKACTVWSDPVPRSALTNAAP